MWKIKKSCKIFIWQDDIYIKKKKEEDIHFLSGTDFNIIANNPFKNTFPSFYLY